jgi:hypothetical protein
MPQQQLPEILQKLGIDIWPGTSSSSSSSSATVPKPDSSSGPRHVFTKEELSQYTGGTTPNSKPEIYIAILGEVFDVTSKPEFYSEQRHHTPVLLRPEDVARVWAT